jgi:hypothetical protein
MGATGSGSRCVQKLQVNEEGYFERNMQREGRDTYLREREKQRDRRNGAAYRPLSLLNLMLRQERFEN